MVNTESNTGDKSVNSNSKSSLTYGLAIIFILFLAIILSASFMGVFKGYEPYQQLIAAMLSVAATGVITALLLIFQRKQQEELNEKQQRFEDKQKEKEKERLQETKIFEERLRIYKEFLQKLCDVVKDQKITPEEEIELQFQVAYITMHTSTKSINSISQQVSDIVVRIKNNDKNQNLLIENLFAIADVFKEELYDRDKEKKLSENTSEDQIIQETESRNIAIDNFSNIVKSDVKNLEKVIELKDRTRILKQMINNNGSIQRIYNGTVLFHEYFVTKKDGKFVNSNDKIAIDLMPDEDRKQYSVLVFTRQKDETKTRGLIYGIWPNEEYRPWDKDSSRHVHEVISFEVSNEEIKSKMEKVLQEVKAYRDQEYSQR